MSEPTPWTPDEELTLTELVIDGSSTERMMLALPARSRKAITEKRRSLLPGYVIERGDDREWSVRENEILRDGRNAGLTIPELMLRLPGRSKGAITGKCHRLGLDIGVHHPTNVQKSMIPMEVPGPPPKTCQWIHGDVIADADWSFCGKPVEPGGPWCPAHRVRVFRQDGSQDDVDREAEATVSGIGGRLAATGRTGR